MKRILRNVKHAPIVDLSDTDDVQAISSDEEYILKKKVNVKRKVSKRKSEESKGNNEIKESTKLNKTVKNEKLKATKRTTQPKKKQENEIEDLDEFDGSIKHNKTEKNEKLKGIKRTKEESDELNEPKKKQRKVAQKPVKKNDDVDGSKISLQKLIEKSKKQGTKNDGNISLVDCIEWTEVEYVSEIHNVNKQIVDNVTKLFNEDNTIPFIARYRKCMTGGMEPDQLRALKESYDQAKTIKQRAATILKAIDKLGKWTPEIHSAIKSTKSLNDLEHIYSLFKPASKRSLAERARDLGLEPFSTAVLQGQHLPHLSSLVNRQKQGLQTEDEVKEGIIHLIADVISKDKTVFDKVKLLQSQDFTEIYTTASKSVPSKTKKENTVENKKNVDEKKYENYFNFKATVKNIKPHQILAINRGEAQKLLTVKIVPSDSLERAFKAHCLQQYKCAGMASKFHLAILHDSIDYTYKKLIKPLIVRRVRSEMKEKAETASIEVFVSNVKQLLLTPPVRGKVVLGIDPGFYHGCKLAVVSEHGNVLDTAVIYPHKNSQAVNKDSVNTMINLVKEHTVTILALGNATACRETEVFITRLIQQKAFGPMHVSYTIVDEAGASIYSCGAEAKSEFPNLDPNIISAISIARRLQDPLAELVKVEPKHLGVGMYQHDLPEKQLMLSLNEVVTEAVSFVGVDINTASHSLLKRVAGLNSSRATNIIEWRNENGPFTNRTQVLKVKGIGNKSFEQCAGFIRILPETALIQGDTVTNKYYKDLNFLDQTWIHPESYSVAEQFLKYCKCNLKELGTVSFIDQVSGCAKEGCDSLAKRFSTSETTMEIIIKGLTMKKDEDIRLKKNYPLFRDTMQSINDLSIGTMLSGVVRNITHFGAFVDIGVGRDALIHIKWMKNETLGIGKRVEVKVISIERERNRISLELIKVL